MEFFFFLFTLFYFLHLLLIIIYFNILKGYKTELYCNRTLVLFVLIVGTNWFLLLNIDSINIHFDSVLELVLTSEHSINIYFL